MDLGFNNSLQLIPNYICNQCFTGQTLGTTVTFVIIDCWTVTVALVGDSRCILESPGGLVSLMTVDHRLEVNPEE